MKISATFFHPKRPTPMTGSQFLLARSIHSFVSSVEEPTLVQQPHICLTPKQPSEYQAIVLRAERRPSNGEVPPLRLSSSFPLFEMSVSSAAHEEDKESPV